MKSPLLAPLSLALLLAASAACGRPSSGESGAPAAEPAPTAPASAEAGAPPPLPSDVAEVASIAGAAPAPGAAGEAVSAPSSAGPGGPVAATGELVAPVRSELAVRNPGRVRQVYVEEGDRVRRGQKLLDLETEYLALDVQRADAGVAQARAAAAEAERDFRRKEELIAKQSVAQAAYDRSRSAWESAQAAVQSAVVERDLARQRLADAALRSPIDGVVAERRADPGERLGENSVALVLVQTAPLKLRFRLPERHLAALRPGQAVRATVDPYPGETFTGQVSTIGRVVDPASRTVMVETEFANRDGRLSPGLFARVEIDLADIVVAAPSGPAAPTPEKVR
jgi:membrane fusion protein, multidrug efflux system